MAVQQLERPGVKLFQKLAEATLTIFNVTLPAVVIGQACQIEEDEAAGLFNNVLQSYAYPKKVVGAEVDIASVVVKLVTAEDTFDITNDGAVTITDLLVTIAPNPDPEKEILAQVEIAIVDAGKEFEDAAQDYFATGVRVGDVLVFVDDEDELTGVVSMASQNLGDWIITDITKSDKLEVLGKTPAFLVGTEEETFEITSGVNDLFVVDFDDLGDVTVTLSPSSAASVKDIVNDLNGDPTFAARGLADVYKRKLRIRSLTLGSASKVTIGEASPSANPTLGFTLAQTDQGSNADVLQAETDVEYKIIRRGSNTGTVLISYKACRTDEADELIQIASVSDIETKIGAIDIENPLGFAAALCLAASGNIPIFVVLVTDPDDATSHQRALEFLEPREVYAMAPLTQAKAVHDLYAQHVVAQSQPSAKRERKVYINPKVANFQEYQASSATGDLPTAAPTNRFSDVNAEFVSNGVPVGAVLSVTAVSAAAPAGQPSGLQIDGAYRTLPFEIPIAVITSEAEVEIVGEFSSDPGDVTYSVKSKNYSASQKAANQAGIAQGYNEERVTMVHPDTVIATVDGVETEIPGYFAAAVLAGMRSGLAPSQGFTNLPTGGVNGVKGSNDIMTEADMNTLAGGGVMILIQDTPGAPVTVRHQLTTAVGDIKTREESILTARDHLAKRIRLNLSPLIGRFNVTKNYVQNQVRVALNGVIKDEVDDDVIGSKTTIQSLAQVPDKPDTVAATIRGEFLSPANFIEVTILI